MYHLDDDYFTRFNQPSSSSTTTSVQFPSESLRFGSNSQLLNDESTSFLNNSRFRSHSADTRRSAFQQQPRTISDDNADFHNQLYNTWNSSTQSPPVPTRTSEINFPSQQRPRPASTTPWSHSEYHQTSTSNLSVPSNQSFSEHLRERSPASGTALLNLLSRYPSAQHSVQQTPSVHAYFDRFQPDNRSNTRSYTYQSSDPNFPLIEYSVRSDEPNGTRTTSVYQNTVPSGNNGTGQKAYQRIQTTFTSNGPVTSTLNREFHNPSPVTTTTTSFGSDCNTHSLGGPSTHHLYQQQQQQQHSQLLAHSPHSSHPHSHQETQFGSYPFENRSHQFYNNISNSRNANRQFDYDASSSDQLELLAARLLDDNMSRSTSEWTKSFEQLQNRFQNPVFSTNHNDAPSPNFINSGSMTLPRRGPQPISKSSSNYEVNNSLLGKAVERRAAEAPETQRSGALDNFWSQTMSSRPSSPTVQRIPNSLTAAERLQLLQEPVDLDKRSPQRVGTGQGVAARKAELMRENAVEFNEKPRSPLNPAFPTNSFLLPSFNDLDKAVQELSKVTRNNAFISEPPKRVGGCGRFPTGEHAFSPPPSVTHKNITIHRKLHSPSPTDENSDSSSVYQIPTGLPHPKPKHNVKEQLYLAGIQTPTFQMARSMYRNGPNFPVPSTGSVASRITEFERRPGTPTIQLAHPIRYQETTPVPASPPTVPPVQNGNMSPRSAVFRAKPVIHVDMGNSNYLHQPNYQPSPPIRNIHVQVQQHPQPIKQFDSSTHSIFDFKSNNVSAASATQIQADVSPTKSPHLAELHVASPIKRTSSAPSPRSNINGSLDTNGNYGKKSVSQNDINYPPEIPLSASHKNGPNTLDLGLDNILNDEQYRPTPKYLAPIVKPPQPKLIAPKDPIYFPQGKPVPQLHNDAALRRVCEVFRSLPGQKCEFENIADVCEAAGLPLYWKMPVFMAITNDENRPATQIDFTSWWKAMTSVAHDEAARFVYTLTMGSRSYLVPEDLYHMLMDVIHTHPGLAFYRDATEFHDKYCQVVMTRIFWNDAHSWSGRLTTERLRRGGVLEAIRNLSIEDDINKSLRYFSYEHFYVVYCKFWEIDNDHDLKIHKNDLASHAGGALVPLIIDRIFSGAVCMTPSNGQPLEEIGLPEFTQFLLAEEDKTHPTSVEYWFRILDLDGDGIVTLYDMEIFHSQIQKKLAAEGIDSMAFPDVACQLFDMLNVHDATSFRLTDLKKSQLRGRFINTFVNWRKFFVQETNEGSESPRIEDEGGQELTEWDRYCIEEYEAMMEDDQADAETISLNLEEDDSKTSLAYHDLL